jgi:histidine ammonia-lyase
MQRPRHKTKTQLLRLKNQLSLEELNAYAIGEVEALELEPSLLAWAEANHEFLLQRVDAGWPVYGAVTGFGSSSASRVAPEGADKLQQNLYRYHGCGVSETYPQGPLAAILLVRLNCLLQGCSGVSGELLQRLALMLEHRIWPLIPKRGSVGASGDLTPLSYIAAVMAGERLAWYKGEVRPAAEIWAELGLKPYTFRTREALAMMNGTSVMTALASLAWLRLTRLYEHFALATAALVEVWEGASSPFMPELHARKPHFGQQQAAENILRYLREPATRLSKISHEGKRAGSVQDPYSIRCAPQILGSFKDALNVSRLWIETELNSVNDNPVILHDEAMILNGGHFMGQHITLASDMLKASLANAVNLIDRQMALLMESKGRLPDNLVSTAVDHAYHHGFKAMQITVSALASEIAKMAMPLSAFSRPTEASNQDVVSMGTTSARELYELTDLAADAIAIFLMSLIQALRLRPDIALSEALQNALAPIQALYCGHDEDYAMDTDISRVKALLLEGLA